MHILLSWKMGSVGFIQMNKLHLAVGWDFVLLVLCAIDTQHRHLKFFVIHDLYTDCEG